MEAKANMKSVCVLREEVPFLLWLFPSLALPQAHMALYLQLLAGSLARPALYPGDTDYLLML